MNNKMSLPYLARCLMLSLSHLQAKTKYFPQHHPKAPHVRLCRELPIQNGFGGHPSHREKTLALDSVNIHRY